MTETLAQALSTRVAAALPFLSADAGGRAVGLARLYATATSEEQPRPIKLPVPVEYTAADCERNERYLTPDKGTPAILFFEDGGTQPFTNAQFPPSMNLRTATLKLLLWVNTDLLDGPLDEATLTAAVTNALKPNQMQQLAPFADVWLTYQSLPAEASLYGRYSFADVTPLLLPPYRLLGLQLSVRFRLPVCPPLPGVLPGVNATPALC